MAMKYKQVGGSPTPGLSSDFVDLLRSGLTGSFGGAGATSQAANANPVGSTSGISSVLNDILSGGAGKIGGSMATMISQVQKQNVEALRARYGAGGGTSFGTPAAFAEAQYRATEAPQLTSAIGGLQEGVLNSLLPIYAGVASRGIPQAEITAQPNPWLDAAKIGLDVAGTGLGFAVGGPGGAMLGSQAGNLLPSASPNFSGITSYQPPTFDPSLYRPGWASGTTYAGGGGFQPFM